MGLLDGFLGNGFEDPRSAAVMALSGGLLQGNFGAGLMGAQNAFTQAKQAQQAQETELLKRGLLSAQIDETKAQAAERQAKQEDAARKMQFLQNLPAPDFMAGQVALAGGGGPTNANAQRMPQVSQLQGLLHQGAQAGVVPFGDYVNSFKPQDAPINKLDAKDFTPASVQRFAQTRNYGDLERMDKLHFADRGGAIAGLNPFTGQQVGQVAKTGNPFSDLLVTDPSGAMRPNAPLIDAKSQIARSGASTNNISVNTEKNLLNDIAGGLGKSMVTARDGAQAALGTINTVNRLMDALDSGNMMAGPGTTFRQFGLQVGNLLGVVGKDANEKLLNTRQAVQSLAQLELDAAQQMKGQGQITEAERAIIRRAASGDIDGMTAGELRLLGGVLDKTARTKIKGYNQQVAPLKSNPNAAPLAPFLDVAEPVQRQTPQVLKFDAQGNPIR